MALTLVTPPAVEPIGLTDTRNHLRVWDTAEDQYLTALTAAARRWCETRLRRSLITTRWRETFAGLPVGGVLEISRPPCVALVSFQYVDSDGATQDMPAERYSLDTDSQPARIVRVYGESWPTLRTEGVAAPVTVTFDAGYGSSAGDVPESIRHAMLLAIGHWYEHREMVSTGQAAKSVPRSAEALLATESWGDYP